jgi:hypothetical protein
MTIIGAATTWSVSYDFHSDDPRLVIYDRNVVIIHAKGLGLGLLLPIVN